MSRRKSPENAFDEFTLDPEEPVFTSGVVCRLLSIPVWVLKQLDREGLVSPPRKKETVSRLYSTVHIRKLKRCWYYMDKKGVRINGLKVILEMEKEKG
ncbi:MAG: MerR family transcriptional regulator [Candidatus Omnitrophica bacterium]|nr:MerR family transcriptional regulator [Candidatus Omnitrophota bacterium]